MFVCPRVFTTRWRNQLYKVADLVFEIPCGAMNAWDISQHEPLVVGIVFPFIRHRPWQLRNVPKFLGVARKLCTLWKEDATAARHFLCQLFKSTRTLDTLPKSLVWDLLQVPHTGLFSGLRAPRRGRFHVEKEGRRKEV
jgi:hypothetical protein